MIQASIPLSPIFVQMLLKLGESTVVTMVGLFCMKLIRDFKEKVSGPTEKTLPAPAREITLMLTDKQRRLINEATREGSTLKEGSLDSQGMQVAIVLTKKQRRDIKEATGQDPARLKVSTVEGSHNHEWVKAVFDRSTWATTLHGDAAMTASQFVEKWASTLLLVVYLCLKMYFNIKKWTS
jgi:hypothetical protein